MANKPKVVRVLDQTKNRTNLLVDRSRVALFPGKRISKTGNFYWETRRNRSDVPGKTI